MVANAQETKELSDVLVRVQSLSTPTRLALMKSLIDSMVEKNERQLNQIDDAPTIEELEGFLDTGGVPPTDEECDRWLEEERMRKYG